MVPSLCVAILQLCRFIFLNEAISRQDRATSTSAHTVYSHGSLVTSVSVYETKSKERTNSYLEGGGQHIKASAKSEVSCSCKVYWEENMPAEAVKRRGHDLENEVSKGTFTSYLRWVVNLCHHASPGYNICLASLALLLLKIDYSLQKRL